MDSPKVCRLAVSFKGSNPGFSLHYFQKQMGDPQMRSLIETVRDGTRADSRGRRFDRKLVDTDAREF